MLNIILVLMLVVWGKMTIVAVVDASDMSCLVGTRISSGKNISMQISDDIASKSCGGNEFVCGSYLYFNKTDDDTVFVQSGRCISRNETKYHGCGFLKQNTENSLMYKCEYLECDYGTNCNEWILDDLNSYFYFPAYCHLGDRVFSENRTIKYSDNFVDWTSCQTGDFCGNFQYLNHTNDETFFVQQSRCVPWYELPSEQNCASLRNEKESLPGDVGYCRFRSCFGVSRACDSGDLYRDPDPCPSLEPGDFPLLPGCSTKTAWNLVTNCINETFGNSSNKFDICRRTDIDSSDLSRLSSCVYLVFHNCLQPACPSVLEAHPRLTEIVQVLEQAFNDYWYHWSSLTAHIRQETKIDFEPYTRDICEFVLTDPDQILALFDDVCDDTTLKDLIKWGQEVVEETQKATNYADICAAFRIFDTRLFDAANFRCDLDRISEVFQPIASGFGEIIENGIKLFIETQPSHKALECEEVENPLNCHQGYNAFSADKSRFYEGNLTVRACKPKQLCGLTGFINNSDPSKPVFVEIGECVPLDEVTYYNCERSRELFNLSDESFLNCTFITCNSTRCTASKLTPKTSPTHNASAPESPPDCYQFYHSTSACGQRKAWVCDYVQWKYQIITKFLPLYLSYTDGNETFPGNFLPCSPFQNDICTNVDQMKCIENNGCQLCFCADNLYKDSASINQMWKDDYSFWQNFMAHYKYVLKTHGEDNSQC
ncbi:uncharacterized protein LOC143445467 [Clavelina lepadiformis]|uniref:uncharacterized protein LOC143445467 n=1 Tax=Clavelina lepadiformis TaxID=159417 RepID=UPI00404141DE